MKLRTLPNPQSSSLTKILILRFSSFGDIIQCFSASDHLSSHFAPCEIHWAVRSDSADLVSTHSKVDRVWSLDRKRGWMGLIELGLGLSKENFTHVYDAHCNLRSHLLMGLLRVLYLGNSFSFVRRKKFRLRRWLLLKWKIRRLPWPFRGSQSFVYPLEKWGLSWKPDLHRQLNLPPISDEILKMLKAPLYQTIVMAPSAAWKMKRWPTSSWQQLVRELKTQAFIIVGGPTDNFCSEIERISPQNIVNLAGQLSWLETAALIAQSQGCMSGDTGALHLSDYLGKPTLALIGPTAFGFPSWDNTQIMEVELKCRPCT
ncbi:MAG: glycosyltransferase family 9 protein, partial [Bdellovibrionales bacterium]|nr:glycosyltransferase family 9 protein [Bdellovibrionales bacterium]